MVRFIEDFHSLNALKTAVLNKIRQKMKSESNIPMSCSAIGGFVTVRSFSGKVAIFANIREAVVMLGLHNRKREGKGCASMCMYGTKPPSPKTLYGRSDVGGDDDQTVQGRRR
ncbi:hypothetical protein L1887_25255 [Cichorium endivia]|nr:hypothetical protein L1887_25255 [Cichorium endivia]